MIKVLGKTRILYAGMVLFIFFPLITIAAPANFKDVILIVVNILTAILPVIVLLAIIYFLWGLTQYLKSGDESKDEAKKMMLWGIIAFFVMTSIWGLVELLTNTFGTDANKPAGLVSDFFDNDIATGVKSILFSSEEEILKDAPIITPPN